MDHEQASRLFYKHVWPLRGMLLRTASFLTPSADLAEDLVQETLMKAFRSIDKFDLSTNPQPWLTAILRNTRIDHARAAARDASTAPGAPGDTAGKTLSIEQAEIDLPARPESTAIEATELAAILETFSDQVVIAALKRLPEEMRWTLLLVDVQQMDYREAAKILDIPPGTVKSRLHRGRLMLKDDLLSHRVPHRQTTGGAS